MDKTQKNIKVLAIFAYLFAIVALGLSLNVVLAALVMLALVAVTVILAKNVEDDKASLPVVGAASLFFGAKVIDVVLNGILVKIVEQIQEWRIEGFAEKAEKGDISLGEMETWEKLNESLTNRSFKEVMDVIMFIIVLAIIALAVIAIISLLSGKDFSKTFLGKFACILSGGTPVSKNSWVCPACNATVKGAFCGKCGTKKPE